MKFTPEKCGSGAKRNGLGFEGQVSRSFSEIYKQPRPFGSFWGDAKMNIKNNNVLFSSFFIDKKEAKI
ncbi:hypothetical protein [Owenweeksia hongkongensis]|uniref:hypothetical protein n=1 Tax=Owenweeksia hongkongensis TaxID=253245 RepID=UPI003A926100